jgi:hypothetical protein
MTDILNNWVTRFWDWIDQRGVIRRIVLGVAMWMTFWVSVWASQFAMQALALQLVKGLEIVALLGAVTAPVVALGGYVFKVYLDSRP